MKKFNLKDAKAGGLVCTASGKPVRIICTDRANRDYPLVCLCMTVSKEEILSTYTSEGTCYKDQSFNDDDLRMAAITHTRWINIYTDFDMPKVYMHSTEDSAIAAAGFSKGVITQQIEWEGL